MASEQASAPLDANNVLPVTRREWVDQRLRDAILRGEFAPGERLVAAALAARWGISATPLREALARLAVEGLVEATPQRGARVAEVSTADLKDVYSVRALLEPLMLERSVRSTDAAYARDVEEAFGPLAATYNHQPLERTMAERHHRAFHIAILAACGSPWLLRITALLLDHSARYRVLGTADRGGAQRVIEEHDRIRAACIAGDAEGAAALLRRHLEATVAAAEKHVKDNASDDSSSS